MLLAADPKVMLLVPKLAFPACTARVCCARVSEKLPASEGCCVLQFQEAARQIGADEIADVLEEQAADAEDAAAAEEGLDAEGTAAFKAQAAAERQNLAADAKAKAAPDDPPAVVEGQAGDRVAEEVTHPVVNAEGATKDVHEADLDMSHADSAPGTIMFVVISMVWLEACINAYVSLRSNVLLRWICITYDSFSAHRWSSDRKQTKSQVTYCMP